MSKHNKKKANNKKPSSPAKPNKSIGEKIVEQKTQGNINSADNIQIQKAINEVKEILNQAVGAVGAVANQKIQNNKQEDMSDNRKNKNILKKETVDESVYSAKVGNTTSKKGSSSNNSNSSDPVNSEADSKIHWKVFAVFLLILSFGFAGLMTYYVFPQLIMANTEEYRAKKREEELQKKREQEKQELAAKVQKENQEIGTFQGREVVIELEKWGFLNVKMLDNISPKTSENFIRFAYRGHYNGKIFDRMVEKKEEAFIQRGGSDPKDTDTQTANGEPLVDELWEVAPEYEAGSGGPSKLKNTPKVKSGEYYKNYNQEEGSVIYPKGSLISVKGTENSATSHFFITLEDSKIPPVYTIFGQVSADTMPVLEKISKEVDPIKEKDAIGDGSPNQEIKILKTTLK